MPSNATSTQPLYASAALTFLLIGVLVDGNNAGNLNIAVDKSEVIDKISVDINEINDDINEIKKKLQTVVDGLSKRINAAAAAAVVDIAIVAGSIFYAAVTAGLYYLENKFLKQLGKSYVLDNIKQKNIIF